MAVPGPGRWDSAGLGSYAMRGCAGETDDTYIVIDSRRKEMKDSGTMKDDFAPQLEYCERASGQCSDCHVDISREFCTRNDNGDIWKYDLTSLGLVDKP